MIGLRVSGGFLARLLLVLGLGFSASALAQPCDPDEAGWQPTRYYTAGAAVFHEGRWFQARQVNEGKEPGISFDWKELDQAPECDAAQQAKQEAAAKAATEAPSGTTGGQDGNPTLCEEPEQWRFAGDYNPDDLVMHGGMVWKAIGKTRGDMPGMDAPPSWREVEDHCALKKKIELETQ